MSSRVIDESEEGVIFFFFLETIIIIIIMFFRCRAFGMNEDDEPAIIIRNARKSYGSKDKKFILDGLDMTVKRGTM